VTLWSGRFEDAPDEVLWRFTVDTADRRLLAVDIRGSIAHVAMLGEVGILNAEERRQLQGGLESILSDVDTFEFHESDEDVHSAVERRLGELVGETAGKLHTGRSRNDQIALDLKLYMKESSEVLIVQLLAFIGVLVEQARAVGDAVVPSYTHVQQAQAVPLAHHLLAYAWMLVRDVERFRDALVRIDVSPLGAGASGGSSLPIDPNVSAAHLGMAGVFENSMDAVGSRDTAAEFVWCATQAMLHLSRLSEEMVFWSTVEFGWVTFSDAFTTGSSAMPQKKNPDIAELVRGKSATLVGDLTAIASLQKGLPMTYNRDLQEDKRIVFHADDVLAGSLNALGAMLASAQFHPPAPSDLVAALDLAEALVRRGVPFREAHHVVGSLVASLASKNGLLSSVSADDLVAFDPRFAPEDVDLVDPQRSVDSRVSHGGGSMASVKVQITTLEDFLDHP
jgi:argininosuccinate lyase